ncbi:MAG: helix-turn-helix transcriptional regulator [Clostridia bacterium]|nr:helix-turn-helix transcriptional regulator [Clostridia bacterium]
MSFREILKDLRIEKGVTQIEVAKGCGLTTTCICALEQGRRNPTGSTIAALARFFNVSADYLLGLIDDFGAPIADVMNDMHTSEETRLLEVYRNLSPDMKQTLWSLLNTWNPSTVRKDKV